MIENRDHPKGKPNAETERELRKVVSEAPDYAAALLELGRLLVEEHGATEEAVSLARRAAEAEPYQAGYFVNYGYIQLQAGHAHDAELAARYVIRIAQEGQELDEARVLLQKATAMQRSTADSGTDPAPAATVDLKTPPAPPKVEEGKGTIRGVVESTTCQGAVRTFVINSEGAKLTFDFANLADSDYPKTTWIPGEFFPFCKHLPGQTIDVRFKPPVSSGTTEALGIIIPDIYALQ